MDAAFRQAVIDGETAFVTEALAAGMPTDRRDGQGQTALMLAARHGHDDIVEALLAAGARLDVTAKYGLDALMLATINHHEAIALRLVAAGAGAAHEGKGAPGFAGKTALDLARERGLSALVAVLSDGGC